MMSLMIFVTLMALATCDCQILKAKEGDVTELNFSYPCESTRVTLQHGNGAPFYSSANPELLPSSPNLSIVHEKDENLCYLHLTINPVLRGNEGTFILFAYDKSDILPDYPRIGLRVAYPPGKASCGSSRDYIAGEWIAIQCTAPEGSLQGKIVCYQNGMRLPHLSTPETHGRSLRQVILARFEDHRIFCCSCTIEQTKDKCSCNDWDWDPVRSISNNTGPCPDAEGTHVQSPTSSQEPASVTEKSSAVSSLISPTTTSNTQNETCQNLVMGLYVAVSILFVVYILTIIIVGVWKFKHRKKRLRKQNYGIELRVNGNEQLKSLK